MKIINDQQLACFLKTKKIELKEFDYVEGKTTEEYMADHPMIIHGRRFYENPYLWTSVIDMGLTDVIEYLYSKEDLSCDIMLVKAALSIQDMKSKFPIKMVNRYLKYATHIKEANASDEEGVDPEYDIDSILENLASLGHVQWFKDVVELAEKYQVKPRYGSYANGSVLRHYRRILDQI